SEDFWLRDGSVVLVCGAVGFRVHASVLCMHSEAFREMPEISAGEQQETADKDAKVQEQVKEMFDGCPVLRLQDAPSDMRYFLKALYDRSYVSPFVQDKCAHSLFVLASVLQMATKYRVRPLRVELARFLAALFPTTRTAYRDLLHSSPSRVPPPDFHPLLGLEIARQCALPQVLPTACLGAARLPLDTIFDGFRLQDGRWVKSAQDVVRACVAFREKL
ncbi:hypothetical protein K488DRAFT_38439, partial [Vararia minispora EC-137]